MARFFPNIIYDQEDVSFQSETSPETTVQRRFSDFVVLHQLLIENYLPCGVIVPPAPEKNFMGTAKVRFGGNNQSAEDQSQFIRRRKAALERLA